jgi:predicted bacteriocin transport accessory protein
MKKILSIITIFFVVITLVGCNSGNANASDVQKQVDNKESFLLYIGSTTCAACQAFNPTFEEFNKEHTAYKTTAVKLDQLSEEDNAILVKKYHIAATPTLIFIRKGQVTSTIEGARSKEELEKLYVKYVK